MKILLKNKQTILYGIALAGLLLLLKWLEWRFVIIDNAFVIYAVAVALIFTGLGIWLAIKLVKPKTKTLIVEKDDFTDPNLIPNGAVPDSLRLSARELEVLQLMADGLSNQ